MSGALVAVLLARLRDRYDALEEIGRIFPGPRLSQVWWVDDPSARLQCWWMYGHLPQRHGADPRSQSFRDGAEAMALFSLLASLDFHAANTAAQELRERRFNRAFRRLKPVGSTPSRRLLGLQVHINSCDALAPVTERIVGVQAPSATFLNDYAWATRELEKLGSSGFATPRPIPVILRVDLRSNVNAVETAYLYREVLQNVTTQHLHLQTLSRDEEARAATSTRFEIVEASISDRPEMKANAQCLESMARLVELGCRVRTLPALCEESPESRLSVMASLHVLLAPWQKPSSSQGIYCVYLNEGSGGMNPAVLTALQVNTTVKRVELQILSDPNEAPDIAAAQAAVGNLWKWAAYALFSRDASHNLNQIIIHGDYLENALEAIEHVLRAPDPLAAVFDTEISESNLISAACFALTDPRTTSDQQELTTYRTSNPVSLRVLNTFNCGGIKWLRVLLPGYGEAWVNNEDVVIIHEFVRVPAKLIPDKPRLHPPLLLMGVDATNIDAVLAFLRVVAEGVNSIEIDTDGTPDDFFDATEWTLSVQQSCPNLERLHLPNIAQIGRLQRFVDAADAGEFQLSNLTLSCEFDTETSDVIEFLTVLSDMAHPLTRRLQEFSFRVVEPANATRDFRSAWVRMLHLNRNLQRVSLFIEAREPIDRQHETVAIRAGPLAIESKLAFLSAMQDVARTDRAMSWIDTSVVPTVFQFAAEHCVREVNVSFEKLDA